MKRDYEFYLHLEEYIKEVNSLVCKVLKIPASRIILDTCKDEPNLLGYFQNRTWSIGIVEANITTIKSILVIMLVQKKILMPIIII